MQPQASYVVVPEGYGGKRLDNFLFSRIKGVPKSHIYAIIRTGQVRINSKRAKAASRIEDGDSIRIPPLRTAAKRSVEPSNDLLDLINDSIIHRDDEIIVINKPVGIGSHGGTNHPFGVIEIMHHIYGKEHIFLAHRLDIETTGLLLLARNMQILREIHQLWHDKQTRKLYLAVVDGKWLARLGKTKKVTSYIHKHKKSGEYLMKASDIADQHGKQAITHFKLIEQGRHYSMIEAELVTGRTHQIRLHCASEGFPIVGDKKYSFLSGKDASKNDKLPLALHSHKIKISLEGKTKQFVAPVPRHFHSFGFDKLASLV